jgi:hypothetical protein
MGDQNRFFIWVWRFNAILLAVLFLALIWFVAVSPLINFRPPGMQTENFAPPPGAPKEKNVSYRLENYGILEGTNSVEFGLQRITTVETEGGVHLSSGYGRGENVDLVNILVADAVNDSAHWLFKGTDHLIYSHSNGYSGEQPITLIVASDLPKSPVVALVIEASPARPNKNGALKATGPDSLYDFKIGADSASDFFSAENIRSIQQVGTEKLLVTYDRGNSVGLATFSTRDFKPLSQSVVPPVPK